MSRELLRESYTMLLFLPYTASENKQARRDLLDRLNDELAKPEPQVCCGDYEKCIKPCTPKGRWLAEKEFTKEEQLSPVGIGVDVTPEGTHVVAVYRRSDAVEEMFYSQFHPLAKPKQAARKTLIECIAGSISMHMTIGLYPKDLLAAAEYIVDNYTEPPRKEWVGLTINEVWDVYEEDNYDAVRFARAIESKLKELNK
jgi:hypothetical protein